MLGTGFIAEPRGAMHSVIWGTDGWWGKVPLERVLRLPPPARPGSGQNPGQRDSRSGLRKM